MRLSILSRCRLDEVVVADARRPVMSTAALSGITRLDSFNPGVATLGHASSRAFPLRNAAHCRV